MNDTDFNRAADIPPTDPSAQPPASGLLPGFETPAENPSPDETSRLSDESNHPVLDDPFAPPPEASAPPLPGMATPLPEVPPVIHLRPTIEAPFELHPPAKRRAALAAQAEQDGQDAKPAPTVRFNMTTALAALSGVLGIGLVAACISLLRAPETPAVEAPKDIPLALLPETADPDLWETVSGMSGEIDGVSLAFERGMATDVNGRTYRLMLDFCRHGSDIYAKVSGDRTYVVRLDGQGKITKAYPAPKNSKPLKDLFGK